MANPSHILIARNSNSRGLSNPLSSATLSSPTETHAAAAGVFRSTGEPSWHLEEYESEDAVSSDELEVDDAESIEVEETFTKHSPHPGTVKIIVQGTTFWAHKEILVFASPFFEAALSGNWSETGRPQSMSSVITISQPPTIPGGPSLPETEMTFAPINPDTDPDALYDIRSDIEELGLSESGSNEALRDAARKTSLSKLQGAASSSEGEEATSVVADNASHLAESALSKPTQRDSRSKSRRFPRPSRPAGVIILKEEKAGIFHDFLRFVYPHLECTITWNNVEGLMNIADKLCVHSLRQECLRFLLTSAAGKPIKAMRIAELFEEEDLYQEASRFVLENPGGWPEHELATLSKETLLKLEKRRNWFLERVLKLGLTNFAKEYQCCASCPEPANCARMLEEKWKHAYQLCFRFGPCQPSIVYRYLRSMEGINPPLALTHLACQNTAKAFVATLFDRMFSLGVRGNEAGTVPITGRVGPPVAGPRRHFLYCSLGKKKAKSRIDS